MSLDEMDRTGNEPTAQAVVQAAFAALNKADTELVGTFAGDLKPDVLANILMQFLSCDEGHMTQDDKVFWLAVARELGSDWIARFHHVSGFMRKLDEF